jgi:hypothetical protein
MTVGELIDKLKSYDRNLEVRLNCYTELNIDNVYETSEEYIHEKSVVTIDVNLY